MGWPYRDVTVGDLLTRLAAELASHPALLYDGGPRYNFEQLDREARTIARGLMAHGVAPGERVVLWATNVPEWVVLQFALAKIGAILVTANTALRAKDIDYVLRQSEAATLITIRGFREVDYVAALTEIGATRGAIAGLERLIFIRDRRDQGDETPAGFSDYEALRAAAAAVSEVDLAARGSAVGVDDVINMQYTSGTTGFPKGVMLSSRNIVNNGCALAAGLAYTPADRLCLCVPLFHCFGCVIGVLGAYSHGACLCPLESFDPRRVLETVERERCTALYGVPTMFLAELEHPEFARFDLTSLRTGVMAGSLCPEPLMRRVMSEMHIPEITIAYGLTEASPGITMTPRDSTVAQRACTVGIALPEMEAKIVDPVTGAARETGERGELCVRGYNVMKGYYNNPAATRTAIDEDNWLHTGDEASVDEKGFFSITGRIKDLIIRGGENISPKEIEDCLRTHPAVADAYVYGIPDAFFGEIVAAAVRLNARAEARAYNNDAARAHGDDSAAGQTFRSGALPSAESDLDVSPEAMIVWCAERLARFKVPKLVRFVADFPMTASGKVQKYKLQEAHQKILAS
jgi:fatty-acyl-CoA synthase